MNFDAEDDLDFVPLITPTAILEAMGMPELIDHFEVNGITSEQLLYVKASEVASLLPRSKFNIGTTLCFMQRYVKFVTDNGLVLHDSFNCYRNGGTVSPSSSGSGDKSVQSTVMNSSVAPPVLITVIQSPSTNSSEHALRTNTDDTSGTEDTHAATSPVAAASSDGETLPARNLTPSQAPNKSAEEEKDSDYTPSVLDESSDKESENDSESDTSSSELDDGPAKAKPLVQTEKLGQKRRMKKRADQAIHDLDLRKFLKRNPLCKAVMASHKKIGFLKPDDRNTLSEAIVIYVLKLTENPTQSQYEILADKLVKLFPKEKPGTWYLPPKSEGPKQKCAKGKLPDKVKNSKFIMRKKGGLPPVKRRKLSLPTPSRNVCYGADELLSKEWLLRNKEPQVEVRQHWRVCATPRLKELHSDPELSAHDYVKNWNSILMLNQSYQLILDDFNVLPEIDKKYLCVKDKSENLLRNWNPFREGTLNFARGRDSCLSQKDKKDLEALLEQCPSDDENAKDYIVLSLLPNLCKQLGRVKLGKVSFKPSAQESKDAFILHVPGASEFERLLQNRIDRHSKFGAPLQPYVAVQEDGCKVRASYVIFNTTTWKVGSVLSAIDICFKTCWVLNCGYPPEAHHLWQLLQNSMYDIKYHEDKNFATVNAFLSSL